MKFAAVFFLLIVSATGTMKFHSLHCEILDPTRVSLNECRIRAIGRKINSMSIRVLLKETVNQLIVNFKIVRRERGGWHPFLYDITMNICDFYAKRFKHIVARVLHQYIKDYTNVNHTCPYMNNTEVQIINWHLDETSLIAKFPLDRGEYGLKTTFYHNNVATVSVNGSVMYEP